MKGISPLVASVILIAATMSIAGILSYWASSFVQRGLTESGNTTQESQCLSSQFRVYSGRYTNASKSLTIILENQRLSDISLSNVYMFYPNDELKSFNITGVIAGNELKTFNVSNIDPGFTSGEIRSTCPQVVTSFKCGAIACS